MTDLDDKIPRLSATYPINKIARGDIDIRKFRELNDRIQRRDTYVPDFDYNS